MRCILSDTAEQLGGGFDAKIRTYFLCTLVSSFRYIVSSSSSPRLIVFTTQFGGSRAVVACYCHTHATRTHVRNNQVSHTEFADREIHTHTPNGRRMSERSVATLECVLRLQATRCTQNDDVCMYEYIYIYPLHHTCAIHSSSFSASGSIPR